MSPSLRRLAAIAAATIIAPAAIASAPQIMPSPLPPGYGDELKLELLNSWPAFLPASRFVRSGNSIVVEYEYVSAGFSSGPQFAPEPLKIGELPPGNYTVTARLFDINQPNATPQTINTTIGVVPPADWGIYTVPREPKAFMPAAATVRSAAYFDPSTLRATVSGNTIRVDFDYDPSSPVGGATPPGMSSFGSVNLPALQPGAYHLEGWGRAKNGGTPQKYFTRDFSVASAATIVEYYAPSTDHYFITASPDDVALLDNSSSGWMRTGLSFKAWLHASDAPPNAQPVCRFYTKSANSHFYTGNPAECSFLQSLEASQRADAAAKGQGFMGWQFEGTVFYALVPSNGQCPGGTTPVYRLYNNRAAQSDSNHRFTTDGAMRAAMQGWVDEGPAFCSPS